MEEYEDEAKFLCDNDRPISHHLFRPVSIFTFVAGCTSIHRLPLEV